jgi:hypothetical protein
VDCFPRRTTSGTREAYARPLRTPYLPTVPLPAPPVGLVLAPVGVAVDVPVGVIEPGVVAGKPDFALEVADVDVFAVLVAEVTGLMVVDDGFTTAGVGVLAGVGLGTGVAGLAGFGGVPGMAGLVVEGLAGTVDIVPGVGL